MTKITQFLNDIKNHPISTIFLIAAIAGFNWIISSNKVISWIIICLPVVFWLFIIFEFWRSQQNQNSK